MRSSGIKKGLAGSAITALAISGIPLMAGSANAVPLDDQVDAVTLLTGGGEQYANTLSFDNDGTNTTESLVAVAPEGVTSITFQYRRGSTGEWQNVAAPVTRNADGAFATEWTRPNDVRAGDTVELRAVPNTGLGNADSDTLEVVTDQPTVELATEGNLGIYRDPVEGTHSVAVRGTVSDPTGLNDITVFDAVQDATGDSTPGRVGGIQATRGDNGRWTWNGVLEYAANGYQFSPGTEPNQAALTAAIDTDEDTEASSYYVQDVQGVSATPARTNVPDGGTTNATVTVTDQRGNPVAGARVGYTVDDDTSDNTAATDNANAGRTDANGQVTLTGLGRGTYVAYADTNGTAGYQPADVEAQAFTVASYAQQATAVSVAAQPNRNAYDLDELSGTTFTASVDDQQGNGVANQPVQYRWTVDPSAAGPNQSTAWTNAGQTDGDGEVTVPFTTTGITGQPAGTWTLEVRRPNVGGTGLINGQPLTFQAAESEITFAEGANANAPVNGTYTVVGRLALTGAGGANLAGRTVSITETGAGDVSFAPAAQQPNGTTVSGNTATATTDANGEFRVALTDPGVPPNVPPTPDATVVNAVARDLQGQGDVASADAAGQITVNFAQQAEVGSIDVDVEALFDGNPAPGKPVDLDITVRGQGQNGQQGGTLNDVPVTVTVDKGFLSPNAETRDDLALDPENDDAGDLFGVYRDLGQEEQVSTGDAGDQAGVVATIGRDEGFDDDGRVTATITVTAGGVTETETVTFDSRNALNIGELELVRDGDDSDGAAGIGQDVDFNLFARDQFGNLVGDREVTISDDTPRAEVRTDGEFNRTTTDFATSNSAIVATSQNEVVQTLTATLNDAPRTTVDADGDPVTATRTATADSEPISWQPETDQPGNGNGGKKAIVAKMNGKNNGGKRDVIRVKTWKVAAGAKVKVFRIQNGNRKLMQVGRLNKQGGKWFRIGDKNGRKFTKYVAKVVPQPAHKGDMTNVKRVR
ncbi:Ig-like domain-containing protein [Nocardioides deserti]|uniref:Big-1 domain-containing protein n=1 Tax=Nocardioides deserti TaxID=1588644 RepID=A0ABR6U7P7_9ACTN|nr:Ig-like domain-containing protein [Nocardioides deserti]MBC2960435.1 hypothetical protein [Nocardioides deserti]GGO71394.1 hypothetical protein GCM10012276_12260 [Nocardioides deserti]